jgi:hypothetical protein
MISATAAPGPARSTALVSTLTEDELAAADHRYPKWATMCLLRRLGLSTLDACLITPHQDHLALDTAVATLANAIGRDQLMVRSDGGTETHRYYRGGNTFPLDDAAAKASSLLRAGRAVILMEPTNRFTNRLAAVLRIDRDSRGRNGTFTLEALGAGYDVADLTRGGIPPQVTVTAEADWTSYPDLWWSDLRMSIHMGLEAECARRRQRLARIATDILTDTGHIASTSATTGEQAAEAEAWLRDQGYHQLWGDCDVALDVARRVRRWFDDAFMIGLCHPRRGWTCLATAISDLGDRCIFWDIVDGRRKYSTGRVA